MRPPNGHAKERFVESLGIDKKRLYKISEIMAMFGVARSTVSKWFERGQLAHMRIPGLRVRVLGADLYEFALEK
jgi:hypothetical protein